MKANEGGSGGEQDLQARIAEFRADPQKMDVTNKFVQELIEKAKEDALKRMQERDGTDKMDSESASHRPQLGWKPGVQTGSPVQRLSLIPSGTVRRDCQALPVPRTIGMMVTKPSQRSRLPPNKQTDFQHVQSRDSENGNGRKRGRWRTRARGFFSRIFSSLCFCNSETKV